MADEGPTTAGSIVGKLKMDRDQWIVEKAATIKDAKEIGDLNPTVTVHANVAEAIAEMEALSGVGNSTSTIGVNVSGGSAAKVDAVAAAEARMTAAMTAARLAAQAEELAAQRLDAAQTARGRTDISVAAAELALERATIRSAAAQEKSVATGEALAQARKAAAAAALEEGAAEETMAKKANNAGGSLSRIQMILAAVVALGPGLIPIAAFTVGAGAAITAMAGVAVLAVLGIKNELKSGTAEAAAFNEGIASLKTNVSQLEATAATGVLGGFQTVVGEVKADMPELNSMTKIYAQVLGTIAGIGFGGALSFFHSLAPLILDVDSYLIDTTQRLSTFADSPGMRRFVTYAQQSLPTVERLLNSLVTVAFHLLAAFAPWGTLVVDVLTDVSNVISAIPTPVLATLIELALGGSLAFKAWTSIPALFMTLATTIGATAVAEDGATVATGALGAAIDFMEGPIGWVIAGLGALVAVFAASAAAAGTAATATDAYGAALEQDNGVIGEHVRLTAVKMLQDAGGIKMAKDAGVSTTLLTSATLGNAGAQKKLGTELQGIFTHMQNLQNSGVTLTAAQQKQFVAASDLVDVYDLEAKKIKVSVAAYADRQIASGQMVASNEKQADSYARLANQEDAATKAGQLWKQQLDILNGASQSLEGANIALAGDFQNMASTIINNTKQMGAAAARSLDINTAGGLANHQLILQTITDAETQSQAIITSEGNTAKAREDGRQALLASRQSIIDHMVAAGLDRDAVTKLVDAELSIPAHIKTQVEVDAAAAASKLARLKAALDSLANNNTDIGYLSRQTAFYEYQGYAVGGTLHGPGSSTSDSIPIWGSVGEEVTRASRAGTYRPMLKAINDGSQSDIAAQAARLTGPQQAVQPGNTFPTQIIVQADPAAAFADFQRRQNLRVA